MSTKILMKLYDVMEILNEMKIETDDKIINNNVKVMEKVANEFNETLNRMNEGSVKAFHGLEFFRDKLEQTKLTNIVNKNIYDYLKALVDIYEITHSENFNIEKDKEGATCGLCGEKFGHLKHRSENLICPFDRRQLDNYNICSGSAGCFYSCIIAKSYLKEEVNNDRNFKRFLKGISYEFLVKKFKEYGVIKENNLI